MPENMHGELAQLWSPDAHRQADRGSRDLQHNLLVLQAVPYELRNGDAFEPMLLGKVQEVHEPRHAAVPLVHDLAEAACGVAAGKAGQVHPGLCVPWTYEDPTGVVPQGEDVPRPIEVCWGAPAVDETH